MADDGSKKQASSAVAWVAPRRVRWTLLFHVVFFLFLSGAEFLFPEYACRELLAAPLTNAGITPDDMCFELESNPVGSLVFYGLRKYHFLWFAATATFWALSDLLPSPVLRVVLLMQGLNFAMDDAWAATHLFWTTGPQVLVPQALLILWDFFVAFSI
eukprot:TRINITY_DN8033_c0_g1_i1.p1 TRINITY_DN8033_c0_g1~~TRINITY_DN8033_c0_g1_i1.p1  ORF type:complete len:168 (+),score=50.03 TRINITY_DN8033_c0_g1_i1:32-505(+)